MFRQGEWKKKLELIHRALVETPRYQKQEQEIDDTILNLTAYIEKLERENAAYKKQLDNMYD